MAQSGEVMCGVARSTLRQVLEYSPQSTLADSARRCGAYRIALSGNGAGKERRRGQKKSRLMPWKRNRDKNSA